MRSQRPALRFNIKIGSIDGVCEFLFAVSHMISSIKIESLIRMHIFVAFTYHTGKLVFRCRRLHYYGGKRIAWSVSMCVSYKLTFAIWNDGHS